MFGLQLEGCQRDLAMFNLAIDSKLRGGDLVRVRIDEMFAGGRVRDRAAMVQKKTGSRGSERYFPAPCDRAATARARRLPVFL